MLFFKEWWESHNIKDYYVDISVFSFYVCFRSFMTAFDLELKWHTQRRPTVALCWQLSLASRFQSQVSFILNCLLSSLNDEQWIQNGRLSEDYPVVPLCCQRAKTAVTPLQLVPEVVSNRLLTSEVISGMWLVVSGTLQTPPCLQASAVWCCRLPQPRSVRTSSAA